MTMVDAAVMTVGAVRALIIEATLAALVTMDVTMVTMVTMVGTVVVAGEQAAVEA